MNVLLAEILAAREQRAQRQQQLLREYGAPLVCFTMNIPGPVKNSPLIRRAFEAGLSLLDEKLTGILFRDTSCAVTGCEAFYSVDMPSDRLKAICTGIEESCSLGRLFDMDVLDLDGHKLERPTQRGCMVCGAPGRSCAATRAHSVQVLQQTTRSIITEHFASADARHIASLAVRALLDEVHTTPKPGLVDAWNCGSHRDMDIALFTASANALRPYFRRCVEAGQQTALKAPEETFPLLRAAGMEAEQQMFAATNGVNTHKGAIFTLGILCGAVGRLWRADSPIVKTQDVLAECSRIVKASMESELAAIVTPKTAGEQLYLEYGLTGIRGEAAAGFPSVARISLPAYRDYLSKGLSPNDAGASTLLHLIAHTSDTNLYHRGGIDGARFAAEAAAALLPEPTTDQLRRLDAEFIARNLSPGGCADLLAATYLLDSLEKGK